MITGAVDWAFMDHKEAKSRERGERIKKIRQDYLAKRTPKGDLEHDVAEIKRMVVALYETLSAQRAGEPVKIANGYFRSAQR
jgi:hypothetical protein